MGKGTFYCIFPSAFDSKHVNCRQLCLYVFFKIFTFALASVEYLIKLLPDPDMSQIVI